MAIDAQDFINEVKAGDILSLTTEDNETFYGVVLNVKPTSVQIDMGADGMIRTSLSDIRRYRVLLGQNGVQAATKSMLLEDTSITETKNLTQSQSLLQPQKTTLAQLLTQWEQHALVYKDRIPFDFDLADALIKRNEKRLEQTVFRDIKRQIAKAKNAVEIHEEDDKYDRLKPIANYLVYQFMDGGVAQSCVLPLIGLLHEKRSDIKNNKNTCFDEGVRILYDKEPQVAIDFMVSNGRLPDALRPWKYFIAVPWSLVYVISKGFKSPVDKLVVLPIVQEISRSVYDQSTVNTLLYALLKAAGDDVQNYADLFADEETTKIKLVTSLQKALAVQLVGWVFYPALKSPLFLADIDDCAVFPCDCVQPVVPCGSNVRVQFDINSTVPCKVKDVLQRPILKRDVYALVQKKLSNISVRSERQKLLFKFINDELQRLNKSAEHAGTVSGIELLSLAKPQGSSNVDYSVITRKIQQAKTLAEYEICIQMLKPLAQSGYKTAIKDLIMIYTNKTVQMHNQAVLLIEQANKIFSGSAQERISFLNLSSNAFISAKEYDKAITCYFELQQIDPQRKYSLTNQIAYCYLQNRNYKEAIKYADKTISGAPKAGHLSRDSIQTFTRIAYSTKIYAYIGLLEFDEANKALVDSSLYGDKRKQFEERILNAQMLSTEPSEIGMLFDIPQEFSFGDELMSELFPTSYTAVEGLISPYLQFLLDDCEYEGIRDRGDRNWEPEIGKIENYIHSLENTIGKERKYDQDGVQKNLSEQQLSISKLSLLLVQNNEDNQDIVEKFGGRCLRRLAGSLISRTRSVIRDASSEREYILMLLSECMILLSGASSISGFRKDKTVRNNYFIRQPDFSSAFNQFLIYACETEKIENRVRWFKNYSNLREDEISEMQDYIRETLRKAIEADKDNTLFWLGQLLAHAQDQSQQLLDYICSLHVSIEINLRDALSLRMLEISQAIHEITYNAKMATRALQERPIDVEAIENTANYLANVKNSIGTLDKIRLENCTSALRQISVARNDSLYDSASEKLRSAANKIALLLNDIDRSPTRISFGLLRDLCQAAKEIFTLEQERLMKEHMPDLKISDDIEDGYPHGKSMIILQLRVKNADRSTPAVSITLDILDVPESAGLYKLEKKSYHLNHPIAGGDSACFSVPLILGAAGQEPDALLPLKVQLRYKTIQDKPVIDKPVNITIPIQSRTAFKRISPNPYRIGSPLKAGEDDDDSLFLGRDEDIEKICGWLKNDSARGISVAIYGQYRTGKTSLAYYVMNRLENIDKNNILIFMEITDTFDFMKFSEALIASIHVAMPDIKLPLQEDWAIYPEGVLYRFLEEVKIALTMQGKHMIVVIDEFGRVFSSKLPSDFMQIWKRMMAIKAFDSIVVGHDVITQLIASNLNPFGSFKLHQLNYLLEDAAYKLIRNPLPFPGFPSRIKEEAAKYIWELSAGNAFYIQTICSLMVDFMNKYSLNIVNESLVYDALCEHFDSNDNIEVDRLFHPMFDSGETGTGAVPKDHAKLVLKAVAIAGDDNNGWASFDEICRKVQLIYTENDELTSFVRRVVDSLDRRWVLAYDKDTYEYCIRVRLYRDYLLGEFTKKGN